MKVPGNVGWVSAARSLLDAGLRAVRPELDRSTRRFAHNRTASSAFLLTALVLFGFASDVLRRDPRQETRISALAAAIQGPILGIPAFPQRRKQEGGDLLWRVQALPDFTVQNASGFAGDVLPLSISLPRAAPQTYTFLMFRGLPEGFTLSAGFSTKDHWVVSLRDADSIQLVPRPSYEGLFALEVLLIRGQDLPPERRIVTVALQPRAAINSPANSSAKPLIDPAGLTRPTAVESTAPLTQREISVEDTAMMERADRLLREGDIAAARLLYSRVARKGIAAGALAMAKSYDPDFLGDIPTAGLRPDLAQARDWYRKAEDLGSSYAATRLSTLPEKAR